MIFGFRIFCGFFLDLKEKPSAIEAKISKA
jgi:hypothetical protein